jgi:LmbE family N-acetylglucosaminyl deacetylase
MIGLIILFAILIVAGVYIYKTVKSSDIDELEIDVVTEVEKEEAAIQAEKDRINVSMKVFAEETREAMRIAKQASKNKNNA